MNSTLYTIANQCPLVGGNAVFLARSMYYLIDDEHNYDDPTLCLQEGIMIRSERPVEEATPVVKLTVLPNPATDNATLVFTQEQDYPVQFGVYDSVGKEVLQLMVPANTLRFHFATSGLSAGLYHYVARGPAEEMGHGKLTIVR